MRNPLIRPAEACAFPEFTPEEMYDRIGLTEEMRETARNTAISPDKREYFGGLFRKGREAFVEGVRSERGYRQLFLRLFLDFAYEAREDYRENGIPVGVFDDTFHDIALWAENCKRDYGEMGIEEAGWLWMHVNLELFRLGRLQFEPRRAYGETIVLNGREVLPGKLAVNLHIPQGEPLRLEDCVDSLHRAERFFLPIDEITCHSWLLAPALKELLDEHSNILKFQTLFTVYALDEDSREAEERVFHSVKEDPGEYPEDTGLQRALKCWLKEGHRAGSAFGLVRSPFAVKKT